ncbi:MAG: hypothetical protein QOJ29_2740 [Thermoleophilaceae bacterium]|nr:hypothetical protein [Thermoleophilaceae bacterium]
MLLLYKCVYSLKRRRPVGLGSQNLPTGRLGASSGSHPGSAYHFLSWEGIEQIT